MKKFYDPTLKRVVIVDEAATPEFWEKQWRSTQLRELIEQESQNRFYVSVTKDYIAPSAHKKILEGGCGKGSVVLSLARAGYDAYGIDYAAQAIAATKPLFPELKLSVGDVHHLDFPDASFDGYWSLGVIEHYYDGFEQIISEMKRVLKPGGYLFLTHPALSPLRQLKVALGQYPKWQESPEQKAAFYQFVYSPSYVQKQIAKHGFSLCSAQLMDGLKGLKDESNTARPLVQWLYAQKGPVASRIKSGISGLLAPLTGHGVVSVFKRDDAPRSN